jgi:ubiquitin carboxyl-terminal hydrolase 4/11/15
MNERQKNICSLKDSDFAIDVCWLSQYITEVKKLNDKKDFEMEFRRSNKEDVINIYKCFKNFVSLEKLEENNEWYCPQCKNHQRAEKRMEIYKSPHILVIHLKRFRNHKKIENLVDFPVSGLDISNYVIHKENGVDLVYDLFAIANHVGGLGGGHYYAYAKNYFDNQWYCFNDSSVSKISESELVTSGAYVLFYRRRNLSNIPDMEKIYDKNFEDYENLSIINSLTLNSEKKNKMDTDS